MYNSKLSDENSMPACEKKLGLYNIININEAIIIRFK